MNNDRMPFTNLAEMRDAVLEALPPETIKTGVAGRGKEHELRHGSDTASMFLRL